MSVSRIKKRRVSVLLATLVVVGLGLALVWRARATAGRAHQRELEVAPTAWPTVRVATVVRRDLTDTTWVYGQATPVRSVTLVAEVDTRVRDVFVEVGDWVPKGAVLAVFHDERLVADFTRSVAGVERTTAELTFYERDYQAKQRLFAQGDPVVTERERDGALRLRDVAAANLKAAEADRVTAADRLEDSLVRAPFAGLVTARAVDPEDAPPLGAALFTLADLTRLSVKVNLDAADLVALAPGTPITAMTVADRPTLTLAGIVNSVAPEVDPNAPTYTVEIRADNPGVRVPAFDTLSPADSGWTGSAAFAALAIAEPARPGRRTEPAPLVRGGQVVRVRLPKGTYTNALCVPQTALAIASHETAVFVRQRRDVSVDVFGQPEDVALERVRRVPVVVRRRIGETWAVLAEPSPLAEGAEVIVGTQESLHDGDTIVVGSQ